MKHAALRIDVGGKLLTNYLIENISHKDFNLKGAQNFLFGSNSMIAELDFA